MKLWTLSLTALVAALIGAGIAVGVMAVWEPWDDASRDQETALRLTGAEAAAVVQKDQVPKIRDEYESDSNSSLAVTACETADFNQLIGAWIVVCNITVTASSTSLELPPRTFSLQDDTGRFHQIQ